MAFFGITHLSYQNPVDDKMTVKPTGASYPPDPDGPLRCTDTCSVDHQPLTDSADIHKGSHERYKEMVKRVQTPRSPDQLYEAPVTESQQYGWMTSRTPEPWTQVKRFPRKNSEMTKFVKEMSATDRDFSLF